MSRSSEAEVLVTPAAATPTLIVTVMPGGWKASAHALRSRSPTAAAWFKRGAGHQHREFLAAEPPNHIAVAHAVFRDRGDPPQHVVADRMAVAIVDQLEMVDVEQRDRERLGLREQLIEHRQKRAARRDPGQFVGRGQHQRGVRFLLGPAARILRMSGERQPVGDVDDNSGRTDDLAVRTVQPATPPPNADRRPRS